MSADSVPALQVIAFTGLPGTGKSSLAERLARSASIPAFAGDWLMGSLKPHGVLSNLDRPAYLALYYGLLETLVARQLRLGQSAITDCLITDDTARTWNHLAAKHHAQLRVIECICSDARLHRSRVDGRTRAIPGWHEIGWDHVERMRLEYPPLTVERLVVDAVYPVDRNMALIRDYLAR